MRLSLLLTVIPFAVAAPAAAQPSTAQERPQALTRLLDCRSVSAAEARLACFDQAVAALEAAEAQRELIVMDRQQLRRTRRSLFGLMLPDLNLFSDDNEDEEAISELETTIRGVSRNALGKWVLTLADGARWIQVDSRELAREPDSGDAIRIRRAAMASYLANIDGQIAIRVRRVQ